MARKPGRPRLIDAQCPGMPQGVTYAEAILQSVRIGATYELAARAAGVRPGTLHEWVAQGTRDVDPDPRYAEFAERLETAKAESRIAALASIREAAQGVDERTTRTVRKPVRMRVESETTPGEFVDRIDYVTETTVTEGRRIHWQAGAWLLERTQTAEYGRARVWKDLVPPSAEEVAGSVEGQAAAERAVVSSFAAYKARQEASRARDAEISGPQTDSAGS